MALTALLDHNANPLDSNSVKPLDADDLALDSNRQPANHSTPVDRAELASRARSWRGQGMTLEQVANRLNEAGWTPSAVPSRRNAADVWTPKTISQLLNRDYKDLEETPIITG